MRNQSTLILIVAAGVSTMMYLVAVPQNPPASPPHPAPSPTKTAENPGAKKGTEPAAGALKFLPADALVLTIDHKNVGDGKAQLAVQNTAKPLPQVEHALDSMGFVDALGNDLPWNQAIEITGAAKSLMPNESEHLVLRWKKENPVRMGTYEGFLIVSQDKKEVARQVIRVVVPDPLSAFQPLISKLSLRAYRRFPFSSCWWVPEWTNPGIPLRFPVDAKTAGLVQSPLLAATSRDLAGAAAIHWDQNETSLKAIDPVLGLRINSIPFAGKYDGTLNFGKDAGSSVALTLNASDFIVYPLIWLAICVWLAIQGKRWLGGERQIKEWQIGVLHAQALMQCAEKEFASAFPGFSIHDAFAERCQTIWSKINELRGNLLGSLDTSSPGYQFVITKIPELEAFSKAWVAFGKQLQALKQAMATVTPGTPSLGLESGPAVLQQTNKLLEPQSLTLDQLTAQQSQVAAQTVFLGQWSTLWMSVERMHSEMEGLRNTAYASEHPDDIKTVSGQVNSLRASLWLLSGADDAANKDAVAAVLSTEVSYSKLYQAANGTGPVGANTMTYSPTEREEVLPVEAEWTPSSMSQEELQKRKDQLQKTVTSTDGAMGFLSYLLAVLTGLNQLYFGKPFGTLSDYVTLTLWAFGAKIAVDALSGGLERWVGAKTV